MKLRALLPSEVTFRLECHPEDADIEGNSCSHENCEKCHQWIREQLDSGNEWAWCSVRVVAEWNGFEGDDWLVCCSYRSADEFRQPGGYYDDMKSAALDRLNDVVADYADRVEELFL